MWDHAIAIGAITQANGFAQQELST